MNAQLLNYSFRRELKSEESKTGLPYIQEQIPSIVRILSKIRVEIIQSGSPTLR